MEHHWPALRTWGGCETSEGKQPYLGISANDGRQENAFRAYARKWPAMGQDNRKAGSVCGGEFQEPSTEAVGGPAGPLCSAVETAGAAGAGTETARGDRAGTELSVPVRMLPRDGIPSRFLPRPVGSGRGSSSRPRLADRGVGRGDAGRGRRVAAQPGGGGPPLAGLDQDDPPLAQARAGRALGKQGRQAATGLPAFGDRAVPGQQTRSASRREADSRS